MDEIKSLREKIDYIDDSILNLLIGPLTVL
jgi:chorismate mutase